MDERETDYRYDYPLEEILELASRLKGLAEKHGTVYWLFNNDARYANPRTVMERL